VVGGGGIESGEVRDIEFEGINIGSSKFSISKPKVPTFRVRDDHKKPNKWLSMGKPKGF
jgi:hypothetical protein